MSLAQVELVRELDSGTNWSSFNVAVLYGGVGGFVLHIAWVARAPGARSSLNTSAISISRKWEVTI